MSMVGLSLDVIKCPLCDWTHTIKPLDPKITPLTLAGVFGHGILLQKQLNHLQADVEAVLKDHFGSHALPEWVKRVTDLENLVQSAAALIITGGQNLFPMTDPMLAWIGRYEKAFRK